jgi:nicotinamidase-related amidase
VNVIPKSRNARNPKETTIILVGYQNDYFAKDGILRGVVEEPTRIDEVLSNSLALIETVKDTPVTIVSTPIVLDESYRAMADPIGILNTLKESGAFRKGSTGAETIPELLAFGSRVDYIDGKVGFNALANT